jgi:hypothetical protein
MAPAAGSNGCNVPLLRKKQQRCAIAAIEQQQRCAVAVAGGAASTGAADRQVKET